MLAPTPSSLLSPASPRSMGSARSRSASIFVNKHLDNAGLTHLIEFHEKNENRKKMAVIFGAFAALLAVCVAQEFFFLATAINSRQRAQLLRDTLAGYGQWEPLARAFTNERACSWLYMASDRWVIVAGDKHAFTQLAFVFVICDTHTHTNTLTCTHARTHAQHHIQLHAKISTYAHARINNKVSMPVAIFIQPV